MNNLYKEYDWEQLEAELYAIRDAFDALEDCGIDHHKRAWGMLINHLEELVDEMEVRNEEAKNE